MSVRAAASYRFGKFEIARLWLSYQRYSLLLFGLSGALIALIAALSPGSYLLWIAIAVPVLVACRFGVSIYSRWPQKLRATALASRRIESGRFSPRYVRNYCGDPCFRVVASEILARAGHQRRERQRIIRDFARDLREPAFLLVVDQAAGSVRVTGSEVGSLLSQTASKGERG